MGGACCKGSSTLDDDFSINVNQQPIPENRAITHYSSFPSPSQNEFREHESQRKREERKRKQEQDVIDFQRQLESDARDDETRRRRREADDELRYAQQLREIRNAGSVQPYITDVDAYAGSPPKNYESEKRLRELEASIEDDKRRHQLRMAEKRARLDNAEMEHRRRVDEIHDEFAETVQRIRRNAENRRYEMRRQYEEILRAMQTWVWNDVIERNWTARLNSLRSANTDSVELEEHCLSARGEIVHSRLDEWRHALKVLQHFMSDELANMSEMYTVTGKSFLLDIKEAIDRVIKSCQNLLSALRTPKDVHSLKSQSAELNRACLSIPTLFELKNKYYSQMRT